LAADKIENELKGQDSISVTGAHMLAQTLYILKTKYTFDPEYLEGLGDSIGVTITNFTHWGLNVEKEQTLKQLHAATQAATIVEDNVPDLKLFSLGTLIKATTMPKKLNHYFKDVLYRTKGDAIFSVVDDQCAPQKARKISAKVSFSCVSSVHFYTLSSR